MDLKDIKVIIDLMKKNSLAEFELEKEGFRIKLKRGGVSAVAAGGPGGLTMGPAVSQAAVVPVAPTPALAAPRPPDEELIKSPMIGTFYRAPAPDAGPYVDVGAEVNPESVVCIIEAMKVMNEIKAEAPGVIVEVIAENGKPVEFGQPLFKIRPA